MDTYPATFTEEFERYCRTHSLPPRLFHDLREVIAKVPRYARLRPTHAETVIRRGEELLQQKSIQSASTSQSIEASIAADLSVPFDAVQTVDWLPYCFSLPRGVSVCGAGLYRRSAVAAMDAASMAAVVALRPRNGDVVWDACCAPGMKLGLMADAVGPKGVAVGTDVSPDRLFAARSVLRRQGSGNVCLFAANGGNFTLSSAIASLDSFMNPFSDSKESLRRDCHGLTAFEEHRVRRHRQMNTASNAVGQSKEESEDVTAVYLDDRTREALFEGSVPAGKGFDRVLIDAECSHDGSAIHLFLGESTRRPFGDAEAKTGEHQNGSNKKKSARGIDNAYRMKHLHLPECGEDGLLALQLRLLRNGFAQLRPGGTLVYSTCSFSYAQNEGVVRHFLRELQENPELQQRYGGEAVIVHPFDYEYEDTSAEVSPSVQLNDEQVQQIRHRLEAAGDPYGITEMSDSKDFIGVRFWPHVFSTSFLFVAKIWKRPFSTQ